MCEGDDEMAIEWTTDLSVGFAPVDEQHQELFRRVDGLCNAMEGNIENDVVDRTLRFLESYVIEHFDTEEVYMRAVDFPDLDTHKAEHRKFIETFNWLKREHSNEGPSPSLATRLEESVCGWLRSHINEKDKALALYLNARNI